MCGDHAIPGFHSAMMRPVLHVLPPLWAQIPCLSSMPVVLKVQNVLLYAVMLSYRLVWVNLEPPEGTQ